jgi:hypothetical protein
MYRLLEQMPRLKYPEHTYFGFLPPPLAIMRLPPHNPHFRRLLKRYGLVKERESSPLLPESG